MVVGVVVGLGIASLPFFLKSVRQREQSVRACVFSLPLPSPSWPSNPSILIPLTSVGGGGVAVAFGDGDERARARAVCWSLLLSLHAYERRKVFWIY